jgi:hypothetical protein
MQYLRFFIFKDPFQKDDEPQKLFFARPCPSHCEKSIAITIVEVFGSNLWFYVCVFELSSPLENIFLMTYYLNW